MRFLKASTAATVTVGPFVDESDGVTPENFLNAGTMDEFGVYKNAATALTDMSGTTTFTNRAGGVYTATLSASDTDTVGGLFFFARDDSVCLPVWHEFFVIHADIYDTLTTNSGDLDVNTKTITAAAITSAAIATDAITSTAIATDAITSAELAASAANEIADALLDRADGVEPGSGGTERTVREALRIILAAAGGKLSGAATTSVNIRDLNDTKNVIAATVDSDGNRTAVTVTDT